MMSIHFLILEKENPFKAGKRWGPMYIFLVGFIITLVTSFKGLKHLNLDFSVGTSIAISVGVGLLSAAIGACLMSRIHVDDVADRDFQFASLEKVFAPAMIFTACAMALPMARMMWPMGGGMAAVLSMVQNSGDIAQSADLLFGFYCWAESGLSLDWRPLDIQVMKTVGALRPSHPFEGFAPRSRRHRLLLWPKTGLPVSATHIAVGAVIGVGLANGWAHWTYASSVRLPYPG